MLPVSCWQDAGLETLGEQQCPCRTTHCWHRSDYVLCDYDFVERIRCTLRWSSWEQTNRETSRQSWVSDGWVDLRQEVRRQEGHSRDFHQWLRRKGGSRKDTSLTLQYSLCTFVAVTNVLVILK